jgi:hypothetical protein
VSFADAFNAHDIKAIMSHMTDDCVFEVRRDRMRTEINLPGMNRLRKYLTKYLYHSLMLIGIVPDTSFQKKEVSPSGFLQELK